MTDPPAAVLLAAMALRSRLESGRSIHDLRRCAMVVSDWVIEQEGHSDADPGVTG